MRIGGPAPFNQGNSFPLSLGPGQFFYPPQGQYLLSLGSQSLVQWWDPVNSLWRNISPAGAQLLPVTMDGYNYRIINQSGVVQGATITTPGTGGTNGIGPTQTGTTISFGAAPSGGQAAKGYVIIGGAVGTAGGSATVTQAGSAFTVPPLILIDPPPAGGIQATAVSTITAAGLLNSVTMVNPGAGYLTAPNFYVIPQFLDYPGQLALPYTVPVPPTPVAPNAPLGQIAIGPGGAGSGATAGVLPQNFMQGMQAAFPFSAGALVTSPALAGSGTLTGIVVTNYGSAYTAVPTITFAGGTIGGGVAATALMSWCVTALTGGSGTGYTVGNPWESDLGLFSATTNFINNDSALPRPARGRLTSTAGALIVEDPGFGMQVALVAGNFGVALGGSIPTGTIVFSGISMGGVNDTSVVQASIND